MTVTVVDFKLRFGLDPTCEKKTLLTFRRGGGGEACHDFQCIGCIVCRCCIRWCCFWWTIILIRISLQWSSTRGTSPWLHDGVCVIHLLLGKVEALQRLLNVGCARVTDLVDRGFIFKAEIRGFSISILRFVPTKSLFFTWIIYKLLCQGCYTKGSSAFGTRIH